MKRMAQWIALALALLLLVSAFAGCSAPAASGTPQADGEKAKEIVYLSRSMSDPFASWLANAMKEVGEKEYGYKVTIMDQQNDAAKAVEMLENSIIKKPDAIILQPNADAQVLSTIRKSQEAGIPVIVVNLPLVEDPNAAPTVVCDDYTLGATLAKVAAENLSENAKVVIMNGIPGMSVTSERRRGFQEGLLDARKDVTLLAEQDCNFNKDEAINTMDDWLQLHDDIDAVIAANDGMVLGAIESYKSNGKDFGKVQFYGIDGLADACLSIEAGEETASVLQDANAMAGEALKMVKGILDGSVTGNPTVSVTPTVIDKNNVKDMIAMHTKNGLIA